MKTFHFLKEMKTFHFQKIETRCPFPCLGRNRTEQNVNRVAVTCVIGKNVPADNTSSSVARLLESVETKLKIRAHTQEIVTAY